MISIKKEPIVAYFNEVPEFETSSRKNSYDFFNIKIKGEDFYNSDNNFNRTIPDCDNGFFVGISTANSVAIQDENITTTNIDELKIERDKFGEYIFIKMSQNLSNFNYLFDDLSLSSFRNIPERRSFSFDIKAEDLLEDVFLILKNGPTILEYEIDCSKKWERKIFPLMNISELYDFELIIENRNTENKKQRFYIRNIAINSGFQSIFNGDKKISRNSTYLQNEVQSKSFALRMIGDTITNGAGTSNADYLFSLTIGNWDKNRNNSYGNTILDSNVGLTLKFFKDEQVSQFHEINISPRGISNNLGDTYYPDEGIVGKKLTIGTTKNSTTFYIYYSIDDFVYFQETSEIVNIVDLEIDRNGYLEYMVGNFVDIASVTGFNQEYDVLEKFNFIRKGSTSLGQETFLNDLSEEVSLIKSNTKKISDVITYEDDIDEDYTWTVTANTNIQVFDAYQKAIDDTLITTEEENDIYPNLMKKNVNYFFRGETICFSYSPRLPELTVMKLVATNGDYMIIQKIEDTSRTTNPFSSLDIFEILSTSKVQLLETDFSSAVVLFNSNEILKRRVSISKDGFFNQFGFYEPKQNLSSL